MACGSARDPSASRALVTVGLDFGTTFSGYAYCHRDVDAEKIFMFYEWPQQASGGGQPYCKTQTSLFYAPDETGQLRYQSFGWPASVDYNKANAGHLLKRFKLNLAPNHKSAAPPLPPGLTAEIVITDYLRELSVSIMLELRNRYGKQMSMREVKWCLTVPALWDDGAKQLMKEYAEKAGLVATKNLSHGSPHPLEIVLEPDAAAVYCLSKSMKHLGKVTADDIFLTVDIGGGTVDIVVHQKISSGNKHQLKEVIPSTGGVCGGADVDDNFLTHLSTRIGCLRAFLDQNPLLELSIRRWWGEIKSTFDGATSATYLVPARLFKAWAHHDRHHVSDEVEITASELRDRVFDPVVDKIVALIAGAIAKVKRPVTAIMVVGGFAASPYLMARLRTAFPGESIVSPPDPGGAVCQGAAMVGSHLGHTIVSRVMRKTYGVKMTREFLRGDPQRLRFKDEEGATLCASAFQPFVRAGESVLVDAPVTMEGLSPCNKSDREMQIVLFSTSRKNSVKYTTHPSVREESKFVLDISKGMHVADRKVKLTIFFGGTRIRMEASGVNFEAEGAVELDIDPSAFWESPGINQGCRPEQTTQKRQRSSHHVKLKPDDQDNGQPNVAAFTRAKSRPTLPLADQKNVDIADRPASGEDLTKLGAPTKLKLERR